MKDKSAEDEAKALTRLPFLLAVLLAILAFLSHNGVLSAVLVMLSFFVGYLPVEKLLFFIDSIETSRRSGREVLHRLSDAEIEQLLTVLRSGGKLEAIKDLRAINHDGLKDAKNAIDLLHDFGLKWRETIDRPPR